MIRGRFPCRICSQPIHGWPKKSALTGFWIGTGYLSEKERSAYVDAFLEEGIIDGRLVMLPIAKSTELLFLNKTIFDRFSTDTGASADDLLHF